MADVFKKLGLPEHPVILAPLAGVSDHPFRRICTAAGADLTYVEMISATALIYESRRTMDMLTRHPDEAILGVQVTARSAEEMGKAVEVLDRLAFETIDINMGCPVKKVVKSGCGSAILRDPERVYATTRAAVAATSKPVSVKIRLGWDHNELTYREVGLAAEAAGAQWLTIHGRTRNDTYGDPVDLERIADLKRLLKIPVIGNGNLFCREDAAIMREKSGVDGLMVSRGALGNPWVFNDIKGVDTPISVALWYDLLQKHLDWQEEAYGVSGIGAICMRKHILWYVKGWPNARKVRDRINQCDNMLQVKALISEYAQELEHLGGLVRQSVKPQEGEEARFRWDPKYDMDRQLDRGVGDDGLITAESIA